MPIKYKKDYNGIHLICFAISDKKLLGAAIGALVIGAIGITAGITNIINPKLIPEKIKEGKKFFENNVSKPIDNWYKNFLMNSEELKKKNAEEIFENIFGRD